MRYLFLLCSFITLTIFPIETISSEPAIYKLKSGGNIVFIRHSLAPGNGDPDDINLNDCSTQRNLSDKGIEQAKKIGTFFQANNISFDLVLSSEWCRCKDTANYAFGTYKIFKPLNSFYDEKFHKFKTRQIKQLKKFIKKWDGKKNLILVTHYVVIYEILGISTSSGEIVIATKNFEVIDSLKVK